MIRGFPARRRVWTNALCSLWLMAAASGAPVSDPTGFPFTNETLHYTVNWPSGLSLGEAHMTATRGKAAEGAGEQWAFDFRVDAAVPGFAVADHYHASASLEPCSVRFEREFTHGGRTSHENTEFDRHEGVAHRQTVGGGKSDISISPCARDALTFLYFARRELAQGRVPPHEDILFGGPYQVRLEYTGEQTVEVNGKKSLADRMVATVKGPASEITFEMFLARDPARTPLVIRVPLSLGMFSMELAR